MKVTRFTDYSLRILIYLALKPDELVTIQEIADSYHISKNHLMKVVQELSNRQYVTAIRGKNGGLKLHKSADDINIGNLIREMERHTVLVECFGKDNQCVITPSCQLKRMLAEAVEEFYKCLEKYSLKDLVGVKQKSPLIKQLGISLA
uniref:Rrf2 family transcriptional regulator n=1 Tax=Ningiella ruwaisensis TaxID=2364274 RepID=UPI00109F1B65|nr:Rrf2 family transcriptional regulator [Ningiella ruwaisensis]